MKLRTETGWRVMLLLLMAAWAWSVWAAAQSPTNSASSMTTNRPSLARTIERWGENPLTFKLDEIPLLRDNSFLGEPLWKYGASAVYIFLAFYVSKVLDWIAR